MWQFLGRDVPIDHSHQTASSPALPMMVSKGATPCTHCCYAQLTHARGFHAMRVQPKRNLKPMLLPGSQRAGSPSFLPHAAADDTQPSRGQPNSRPRPPLQRQRPGPQRPWTPDKGSNDLRDKHPLSGMSQTVRWHSRAVGLLDSSQQPAALKGGSNSERLRTELRL